MSSCIHNLEKNYYEIRALLTLKKLFDIEFVNLEHSDKPDLWDEKKKFGIEVVRAFDELREQKLSFYSKNIKWKNDIQQKIKDKFSTKGYEILYYNKKTIGFSSPIKWNNTQLAITQIRKKIDLINADDFRDTKGLYLFFDPYEDYEESDVLNIIEELSNLQSSKTKRFEYFFFDGSGWFYRFNFKDRITNFYDTNDILCDIRTEAKRLSKESINEKNR